MVDDERLRALFNYLTDYLVSGPKENAQAMTLAAYTREELMSCLDSGPSVANDLLTPREYQALSLLAQGHPNKELAFQMGISIKTVQVHLKSIYHKLEVNSRTEAVAKAVKIKMISL